MNYLRYFAERGSRQVECALIGSGGFGRSFLAQARHVRGLSCRVAFDLDVSVAAKALAGAGHHRADIVHGTDAPTVRAAWASGKPIAASDPALLSELAVDVVLEATGDPEAGARHARLAIEADKHVIMVTKETDSVVGPVLARLAAERNRVVSPVDGDQPSLLIGLATWAEVIGLDVIAAGKSSEYDFVFDPATQQITSNHVTIDAPGFSDWISAEGRAWHEVSAARAKLAGALPQRAVPDLCELTVVANALGLRPDRPDLHAPIARITEVADFMAPVADGGLLAGRGCLDVFHCLRLPGEPSFAGGVFVTVACHDDDSWDMLREKGHVVAINGRTAMMALPRHLLGLEAATTVFETALLGHSSGVAQPRPRIDLTAFADQDLPAGTLLTAEGHHHSIDHVSSRMTTAMALTDDTPIPYYLAAGRRLTHAVSKGQPIRCRDVELDERTELLRLRRQQDAVALEGWGG